MEFVFVLALDGGPMLRRVLRGVHLDLATLRVNVLEKETPAGALWRPVAICGPMTTARAAELEQRLRGESQPLRVMRAYARPDETIWRREGWSKEEELGSLDTQMGVYAHAVSL